MWLTGVVGRISSRLKWIFSRKSNVQFCWDTDKFVEYLCNVELRGLNDAAANIFATFQWHVVRKNAAKSVNNLRRHYISIVFVVNWNTTLHPYWYTNTMSNGQTNKHCTIKTSSLGNNNIFKLMFRYLTAYPNIISIYCFDEAILQPDRILGRAEKMLSLVQLFIKIILNCRKVNETAKYLTSFW